MDFKLDGCGGCQTCEMACSYKHIGSFNHQIASIQIIEDKEASGYLVRLIEDASSGRIPCDGCLDIDGDPMCVQFCHKADELRSFIKILIEEKINKADKDGNK